MFEVLDTTAPIARRYGRNGKTIRAQNWQFLTDDQIKVATPSVFAEHAAAKCSPKYTFLPTGELLGGMREAGFFPVEVSQAGSNLIDSQDYAKHLIRFRQRDFGNYQIGDSVPEIALLNSHNRSSSYKLIFGFLKIACLNGLMVADEDGLNHNIMVQHRGDVLDQVIKASLNLASQSARLIPIVQRMTEIELPLSAQILFALKAKELRFAKPGEIELSVNDLLAPRRTADCKNDLWTVFNRVQENMVKGGVSYRAVNARNIMVNRTMRAVNSIDGNVKINQGLWSVATNVMKNISVAEMV